MRVVASGNLPGGESWANVFHTTEPFSDTNIDAADTAFTAFYTALTALLTTGWGLRKLTFQSQEPGGQLVEEIKNINGTVTGPNLPNDVALVISWGTNTGGRTGRGRTFIPGWPVSASSGSGVDAATVFAARVTALRDAAINLTSAPGMNLAVFSRKLGLTRPITFGYIDNDWDTQRRRGKTIAKTRTPFTVI